MATGTTVGSSTLPLQTVMDFRWNGHVATRGLFSPAEFHASVGPLRAVAEAEEAEAAVRKAAAIRGGVGADGRLPFVQVHNPHKSYAAARALAFAPVLAATAAALLGVARARLYQDSLFWKRPGHGITGWHADLWTVPVSTNNFVTVWIPLHRMSADQSPLYYQPRDDDGQACETAVLPEPGLSGEHYAPMEEGDATWHHGWTLHGAPPLGEGVGERLAYTAAFMCDDAPVTGEALGALARGRRSYSSVEVDFASAPNHRSGRPGFAL